MVIKINSAVKVVSIQVVEFLNHLEKDVDYCLARGNQTDFFGLGSDIDIVTRKKDITAVHKLIVQRQDWTILNIIKRQYVHSYFILSHQSLISFQIDFEFDFDWWSFVMLDANSILSRRFFCNDKRVYFACTNDANYMKLLRSVMWGGILNKKYEGIELDLSHKYSSNNDFLSALGTELDVQSTPPEKLIFSKDIKKLRLALIRVNLKKFGFSICLARFLGFLTSEVRILTSNNGLAVRIIGDVKYVREVRAGLIDKVSLLGSPFKTTTIIKHRLPLIERLKLQRDAVLMIYDFESPILDVLIECHSDGSLLVSRPSRKEILKLPVKNLWGWIIEEIN